MGFPLGAGARDIEANSRLSNALQPIDSHVSPAAPPKNPHSRLGASSAHLTELCNMMQTYERHKQWAVEQRRLTIRAPTSPHHPHPARPQWAATNFQSTDTSFSSASSHSNTVHPTILPRPNSHHALTSAAIAARDQDMLDEDQSSVSEDELSDDTAVQPSDNSSTELCKPGPVSLPSLASILAPAPTSLAQYRLSSMQKYAPEVMRQKQEVLLNLFAELSQERLDSLVGLVRLVAAVPDGKEAPRSLSS